MTAATITYFDRDDNKIEIPINVDLFALDATTLQLRHHFMSCELRDTKTILRRAILHKNRSQMLIKMATKQRTLIKTHIDKIEVLI